jgi:hypothetical protein
MREVLLKLLSSLLAVAAVCGFLSACDSTSSNTVTKTVYDTIYTDRFAHTSAVVYGEWSITTATDSADAIFLQDTTAVTVYIFWNKSPEWKLTGAVTDSSIKLYSTSKDTALSGKFTESKDGKKTKMNGLIVNVQNVTTTNWSANRTD